MVSLYFNVFSSLSLSNLLPRVQLASLLNNQNANSLLNRFGIQDTVTDLLNRVGFDQTFSIGNKIGIDRPDSLLNKVELGMNNVINLNQQGLLNPGTEGLYGGNGPGYGGSGPGGYPGSGGGISGTGTYGGGLGVSGAGGGPLGGQTNWQGSTQGSFPIGGNRPRPGLGGYPPDGQGQFGGGLQNGGGEGIGNNPGFGIGAGAVQGQTGNSGGAGGGGMLSGLLNQVGSRLGWGSSGNKNEPKDDYKQAGLVAEISEGEESSEWWINQENSHEYWLEESLRNVLDGERTADNRDLVLKYLVEMQIKKLISTMLEHLAAAKVKPEEQVKMNEAAEMELKKLTPEQIKRIAHDIVEREKSKMTKWGRYKDRTDLLRKPPTNMLSEEDLKRLLVEASKTKEILPDKEEVAKLLETTHGLREKDKHEFDRDANKDAYQLDNFDRETNKTDMNLVVKQLNQNHSKVKNITLRREDNIMTEELDNHVTNGDHIAGNNIEEKLKDPNISSIHNAKINEKESSNKTSLGLTEEFNRPKLYISEQMRNNINELLAQLTSGNTQKIQSVQKSDKEYTKNESVPIGSTVDSFDNTTIKTTSTTILKTTAAVVEETVATTMKINTVQSSNTSNFTTKLSDIKDDTVNLLFLKLFGNTNNEALRLFLPQQHVRDAPTQANRKSLETETIRNNIHSRNTLETPRQRNKNILSKGSRSFRNLLDKKLSPRKLNLKEPRVVESFKRLGTVKNIGTNQVERTPS
ncbi:hypothetical protein WDU94_006454 [Cyamophila willieti]